MASLLVSPTTLGLGLVEDTTTEGNRKIRVALDQGDLEARRLSGTIRAGGEPIPEAWETIGGPPEPWAGFDRTVVLILDGTGRVMLADDASGLVLEIDQPAHDDASTEQAPPDRSGPPTRPNETLPSGSSNASPPPPQVTGRAPVTDDVIPGASPTGTAHAPSEDGASGGIDPLLVGLVVALGLVALAPAAAGPLRRRLWQVRSVAWRFWRRHRRRGPRKP